MTVAELRRLDRVRNERWCRGDGRILVLRHPFKEPDFHETFLAWLERNFPDVRRHFELALLPAADVDLAGVRLLVPWLQDPVEAWSPPSLQDAARLAGRCIARGIPVVNHPARLSNAGKRSAARRLAAAGIRTPRMVEIDRSRPEAARAALPGRILLREDWRHGAPSVVVEPGSPIYPAAVDGYARPIAVEFVDTRGPDGIIRKRRCLVAGAHGIAVHLLASMEWEVRGGNKLATPEILAEEAAHVTRPDRLVAAFRTALAALELDFAAFDYSLMPDGRPIVWEANAFPTVRFGPPEPQLAYRDAPVHRSLAAMAGLYLDRAGLPVPDTIQALRSYRSPDDPQALRRLVRA